jgi:8-oxo-dGTP pyrophosphatase MutT (NUDIX family)
MRREAGAIPYRLDSRGRLEVLLVTSKSGRWIFPKGRVEPRESAAQAALRECFEEAGVLGLVEEEAQPVLRRRGGLRRELRLFFVRFCREAPFWQEAKLRKRRWMGLEAARRRLTRSSLREALSELQNLVRVEHSVLSARKRAA